MQRGNVSCARCGRKRQGRSCPKCGYDACAIRIKWDGKLYRFYCDRQGRPYSFSAALETLIRINNEIQDRLFEPGEYSKKAVDQRLFQRAFERFLDIKEKEYAPSNKYRTYYRNYFGYFADMDVRDIKMKHLHTFYREHLPSALSWKYRNNIMQSLFAFLRWLKRWGEIKELPTFPDLEKGDCTPRRAPDYEEQIEALHNIPADHQPIIEFLMETGMRPGEVCALKIGDIEKGRALVQRTYSACVLRERTKSKRKAWRTLSTRALEIYVEQSARRDPDEFIFINPVTGDGYRLEFLRKTWRKHSQASFDLYSNRHGFGTQMAEMGLGELELQELMGHSDIRSTKQYFHPTPERQRDLLDRRGKPRSTGNVIEFPDRKK